MKGVRFAFPSPISANTLFKNIPGRGRGKTTEYKAWISQAARLLSLQGQLPKFSEPVQIRIYAGETGVGNMDAGNVEKAPTDALVKVGVLIDDNRKRVRSSQVIWVPGLRGMVVEVMPANSCPAADVIAASCRQPAFLEVE